MCIRDRSFGEQKERLSIQGSVESDAAMISSAHLRTTRWSIKPLFSASIKACAISALLGLSVIDMGGSELDNGNDHRAAAIDLQAEKAARPAAPCASYCYLATDFRLSLAPVCLSSWRACFNAQSDFCDNRLILRSVDLSKRITSSSENDEELSAFVTRW